MGKMKLTKNHKDVKKRSKGSSGIPNWLLTTIVVVIIVAVLGIAVNNFIISPMILDINYAVTSESYKVDGNMMTYFYANTYNNLASSYGSLWESLSVNGATTIEQHREIVIGSTTADKTYFADYEGKTWFDLIADMTVDSIKTMLVYCEEAKALGIEYTEKDAEEAEAALEANIAQFRLQLVANGWDPNISDETCMTMMYGSHTVGKSDILDAMEISTLAAKCAEKIEEDLNKKITDNRISKEYADNKLDYDVIDYFYYEYSIDYKDVVEKIAGKDASDAKIKENEAKILEEYKKQIEEVKETTAKLAAAKTLDEFKKIIFDETAYDKYDDLLKEEGVKEDKNPAKDDLATIKDKVVSAVIDEVLKGEEETVDAVEEETKGEGDKKTTTYKLKGTAITLTKEFATAIRSVKEDLFTAISRIDSTYVLEKSNYSKDSDFKKWAFDAQRKDGETKSIAKGDGASDGEFKVKEKKYTETVYFLTKAQYQLTENTRDVSYMLFSNTDTAKKVIAELKKIVDGGKEITQEEFDKLAEKNNAALNTSVENYIEGNMGSYAFDEWIYADDIKKGAYTETPLTMADGSQMVGFYTAEGEPTWEMIVKNKLLSEDFTAKEKAMNKKYEKTLDVSQWVIDRIG